MAKQFLTFRLDNNQYAVEVNKVQEVLEYKHITRIPCAANYVEGLISSRDRGISVINLRKKFSLPNYEPDKETRIIVNADWVKKHILFRDKENYNAKEDYGVMMSWLLTYSVVGKNPHDDVPDGLANFALYVTNRQRLRKTAILHGIL